MRIVLPHLKERSAQELALALAEPGQRRTQGSRDLDAALDCSFSSLSPKTRNHLPFISMFSQRLLLDVATHITQGREYASIMGEELGWGACRTLLREARRCAMLESVSPSVYLMSDHVARFLRRKLEQRVPAPQVAALEREFLRVYSDMGDYFMENLATEEAESAVTGVLAEEANLLRALAQARAAGHWDAAQLVLQPLAQVYKMQERVLELRRLREGLLDAIGLDPEVAEPKGATDLWMYLQGTELNDSIGRGELDAAEAICRRMLAYLQSKAEPYHQAQVASLHHHLGLVAQGKDRPDEAEAWYRRALETNEAQGNEAECADGYRQLGLIAQSRRRYEEAEEWQRRALEVRERLGDEGESAAESYQLGLVAEATFRFQEAAEWYHKARIAYEHVGDRRGEAHACHGLGMLAQAHYDYEEASAWYQRALLIHEELGDEAEAADDCLQMGMIVLSRNDYEEAEEWLHQALGIFQQQGRESAAATAYHHLGVAAHGRRRGQEAEEWYQKALEIMVRLEDEVGAAGTWGQLGLLAEQRGNYSHAVWYVAHTYEIARLHHLPILANAVKHLSRLRSRMGTEAFLASWEEVSDSDILAGLEVGQEKGNGGAVPGQAGQVAGAG
jgi:tetratricopeptide (TPR) repeat protein